MSAKEKAQVELINEYRKMYRAMLEKDTRFLSSLLDDQYSLTHITGYKQSKKEWLDAINKGIMSYHKAEEKSIGVVTNNDRATLIGKSAVDATIYGSRNVWNLQLTTEYLKKNEKWIAVNTVATTFK